MITGSWEETISLLKKIGMYMDAPISLRYGSISKGKICTLGKETKSLWSDIEESIAIVNT